MILALFSFCFLCFILSVARILSVSQFPYLFIQIKQKTKCNRLSKFGLHFFPFVYCVTRIIIYDAPTLVHLPCRQEFAQQERIYLFIFFFCLLVTNCAKCQWYLVVFCRCANFYTIFISIDTKTTQERKRVKRKGKVEHKEKHTRENLCHWTTRERRKKMYNNEWKSVSNLNNVKTRFCSALCTFLYTEMT